MELVYMYVEDFQGLINDFEYNFSSKYKFKYSKETNNINVSEEVGTYNKPENFFGEKISNVTAIIGKNGAGKSTILKILGKSYNGFKSKRNDKYILIYHLKDNLFYIESFWEVLEKLKIDNIEYYERKNIENLDGLYVKLNNGKLSVSKCNKIEGNSINNTEILCSLNNITIGIGSSEKIIQRIGLNEGWEYQYRFLTYAKGKTDIYEAYRNPVSLKIEIYEKYKLDELEGITLELMFEEVINQISYKEGFILRIIYQQLKRICNEIFYKYKFEDDTKNNTLKQLEDWIKLIKNNYEKYINCTHSINKGEELYVDLLNEVFRDENEENRIKFLEGILKSLQMIDDKYFNNSGIDIEIGIDEDVNIVKLLKCIDESKYQGYSDISNILNISLGYLSDGEREFIKLFSSIYSKLENYENIILVLDEPDRFFHPEWSRNFIVYLKENLKIFDEKILNRKYQIILTTHSPFIISDLPNENILMIDNFEIQNINLGNTFGANIHTMLSNQFFMKSTVGEFAKQNIVECIDILDGKISRKCVDVPSLQREKIEYVIENIGEPIVQGKLKNMYRQAFPKEIKDYQDMITKLEHEKRNLEIIIEGSNIDTIDGVMKVLQEKIDELKKKSGEAE